MGQQPDHGVLPGAELMLWCVGGRATLRRVTFPPPIEIADEGGIYVLNDEADHPSNWTYVFIE